MKNVFIVLGITDVRDYMNTEGDFLDTKETVLSVCETKEIAEKTLEEKRKLFVFDDYDIVEFMMN